MCELQNHILLILMFCEFSDVFCGGCQDGSIRIWDTRSASSARKSNFIIRDAHGEYNNKMIIFIMNKLINGFHCLMLYV